MESYELAYRMQMSVPGVVDLAGEPSTCRLPMVLIASETAAFGRQCLMARKLVEEGRPVRADLLRRLGQSRLSGTRTLVPHCERRSTDRCTDQGSESSRDAGRDAVVWTGEFGRTPDNNYRGGVTALGRGHNVDAMNMWFAGGGVNAGATVGATDEIGASAVDVVHPIRDVHITMLHLLGLDDNRLTYFHAGRYKQLSQFGGELINELIA